MFFLYNDLRFNEEGETDQMVGKAREIDPNMVKNIKEVYAMNTAQRTIPAKTGKDLVTAARQLVGEEFSGLNAKVSPAQLDAIARAIVLGLVKGGEETQA